MAEKQIPFQTLESGELTDYTIIKEHRKPLRVSVKSEQEWPEIPGIPKPQVDYSNNSVILLYAGMKMTGGNSIEVAEIVERESALEVHVKQTKPERFLTLIITAPYSVAQIPRTDKSIEFKDIFLVK